MAKQLRAIIGYLLISVFMVLSTNSQTKSQTNVTDNYWLNIGSCPLKINVKENNPLLMKLFLENTSQSTIIDFHFGCVTEENGVIKVKSEGAVQKIEIKSKSTNENILYLPKSAHGNYLSSTCNFPQKSAVINLNFTDGGTWTLKK